MDQFEELKKSKELLDEGIITNEEFEGIKKKILQKTDSPSPPKETHPPREDSESYAEAELSDLDDNLVANSVDSEGVETSVSTEVTASNNNSPKGKSKKSKIALVAAVACIAIIAVALGLYFTSDVSKIQGSWEMAGIVLNGETTASTGSVGGSLNIKGKKWTIELNGKTTNTYSGTIINSVKNTGDIDAVFYDFDNNGKTLKAAYMPDKSAIMVCVDSYFDPDNGMIFTKKK